MKTLSLIILSIISFLFLLIAYVIVWYKHFKPIQDRRKAEYDKLYTEIQDKLKANEQLSRKELECIRKLICLLESMKYKNPEMTQFIFFEWVKKRYKTTKFKPVHYESIQTANAGLPK